MPINYQYQERFDISLLEIMQKMPVNPIKTILKQCIISGFWPDLGQEHRIGVQHFFFSVLFCTLNLLVGCPLSTTPLFHFIFLLYALIRVLNTNILNRHVSARLSLDRMNDRDCPNLTVYLQDTPVTICQRSLN